MNELISAAQKHDPDLLQNTLISGIGLCLLVILLYIAILQIREAIVMRGVKAIDRKDK